MTPGRALREKWKQRRLGQRNFTRWPVRCTACGHRRTLSKHPDEYIRPPRCPAGCVKRDARGKATGPVPMRIDWWRMAKEWGSRSTCFHCGGYSFPHARGRGYCVHNPRLTAEQLQERQESGAWA